MKLVWVNNLESANFDINWNDGDSATREVRENTPSGTNIGNPVSAIGDAPPLTYSLTDTDAGSFEIDRTTGQLKTKDPLDYETKNRYRFNVSVTDQRLLTFSISVIVNVLDIDETQPKPEKVIDQRPSRCLSLGWKPTLPKTHKHINPVKIPEVMIHALEFKSEFINNERRRYYTCSAIEIRTGGTTILNLDGWKLFYYSNYHSQTSKGISFTQKNSQITDQMLIFNPEQKLVFEILSDSNLSLPNFKFELKNKDGISIDEVYSCYQLVQNQQNPEEQDLTIKRFIFDNDKVGRTNENIEDFEWDRQVFSEWLVLDSGGNAPSLPYKQLTTSWGALKLQKTDL